VTVETIQDWVEDYLMRSERRDVAKAYIRYRYKKEVARNYQHDFIDAIREKLAASDVQNQNANVDEHSFGGRTGEASGVMTKKLALDYLISKKARENHEGNMIYIHDLDAYYVGSHNCLSVPFDELLAKGFNTR
jgi:ribonucleoside-triphosphate reductase